MVQVAFEGTVRQVLCQTIALWGSETPSLEMLVDCFFRSIVLALGSRMTTGPIWWPAENERVKISIVVCQPFLPEVAQQVAKGVLPRLEEKFSEWSVSLEPEIGLFVIELQAK